MIHILDSNALQHLQIHLKKIRVANRCVVPEAIEEEFLSDDAHKDWFRNQEFENLKIDSGEYLTAYSQFLNEYNDVSFYSMKGFGDVSILATLNLIYRQQSKVAGATLSIDLFPPEDITLVSNDRNLRGFTRRKFGQAIILKTSEEFTNSI